MTAALWTTIGASVSTTVANKTRKVVVLPGVPSIDFILDAKCKIINVKGTVTMSASDLPGESGGSYVWTTASANIKLVNPTSGNLTVEALDTPSAARDAEVITVTRTGTDGSTKTKTVNVTVAKVTFSASAAQRYGYDDFDTPADFTDDHICVKKSDYTFVKVNIEGGALGTDFDFACADTRICTTVAPAALASFDLRLNSKDKNKASTMLHAKIKCPTAAIFAKIMVHVYTEKVVKIVVAKIYDSTSAGTTLNFPGADFAAHAAPANEKLKEAVVKYDIINHKADNSTTNVQFDTDLNGALSFDIAAGGGAELLAIKTAMPDDSRIRVAIVRDMKSYYYLSVAASIGDTTITVRGTNVFSFGRPMPLGKGATQEMVNVVSSAINVITLSAPLTNAHAIGEGLEFPAAGWSSTPIIIIEGNATLDVAKWTVLHEVGHKALTLADINDATDFMHYQQSWTDYRLRYCPRTKQYEPAHTENQWEKIPRP
jgi:hypothetical protein